MKMTDEEKKAIEYFENLDVNLNTLCRIDLDCLHKNRNILLSLIQKQEKVIDEMAKAMDADYLNPRTAEEIKQYFYRKVSEE